MPGDATLERPLPHNLEAERSILGAILLDNHALNAAIEKVRSDDFFLPQHRQIFERMVQLGEKQQAIDIVTLMEDLSRRGELEAAGGIAYLSQLADGLPRITNVEHYARIVKEKSVLRSLIFSASAIQEQALAAGDDADVILDRAESVIFALAEDRVKAGLIGVKELVRDNFERLEKIFSEDRRITGLATGYANLDNETAGRFVVEIGVTGSEAGDAAVFAENLFEALEIIANEFFDANQAGFDAIFGESENHRLGAIEDHIGIVARGQGLLLNGRRRENQAAQNRFFLDDARVVFDVGDARQAVSELREVGDAARRFQFAAPGQVLHQGDDIDGLLPFAKLQHTLEDLAVLRKEKIVGFDLFHRGVQCMVIQQDRAEDAAFGFEVMRQRFFEGDIARHFVFELFSRMNLTILHPCPISSKRHRDGYVVYNFGKVEKCADRCQESKGKRKGRPRLRGAQNLKTTVRTYSSFLTVSLTLATTSRCNFTGISYSPTALMGSTSTIFFLSIS